MRRTVFHFLLVMATLLLAPGLISYGKVIYVDDDAALDGDGTSWATAHRSLQDALTEARWTGAPVEIRIAQGTYKPDQWWAYPGEAGDERSEHFFRLDDDMSLLGGYAGIGVGDPNERDAKAYKTVLSGDLLGNDAPVTDAAQMIDDPTREDNSPVMCVYGEGSRLDGCVITGGHTSLGTLQIRGGITVSDCTFSANCGDHHLFQCPGAAFILKPQARVVFERCTFTRNAGHNGGAVAGADFVLDDCLFLGNYASGFGGAVDSAGPFTDCVFIENRAVSGGALRLDTVPSSVCTVVRCVFRGNSATSYGAGAILCEGNASIEDCLFLGNKAVSIGGACHSQFGAVKLVNSILVGNQSGEQGGAWSTREGSLLEMINCTILENRSSEASFLLVDRNSDAGSSRVTVRNCVLSNGDHEISSNDSPVEIAHTCISPGIVAQGEEKDWLVLASGNIAVGPCVVDPGYWDANGTADDPNDDFFVEGDYHLMSQAGRWDPASGSWVQDEMTSPCIDAGDPNSPVGYEPLPDGDRINMGAYGGTLEASKSTVQEPPILLEELYQEMLDSAVGEQAPPLSVRWRRGYLYDICAGDDSNFQVPGVDPNEPIAVARRVLELWGDLFMAPSGAVDFEVTRVITISSGLVVRLRQKYAGLEVHSSSFIVSLDSVGRVRMITSDILTDTAAFDHRPDTIHPALDSWTARCLAEDYVEGQDPGVAYGAERSELMIYAPAIFSRRGESRLIWRTTVRPIDGNCGRLLCLDAHGGEMIFDWPLCMDSR